MSFSLDLKGQGTSSSDKEVPLSLAILVKNEKKKETNRSGAERKRRPATFAHRSSAQSSSQTQCASGHSGPVILYTTMVITVLYALIAACGYVYYRHFVKRFTDTRFMCAPTSISARPSSITSTMMANDNFNLAAGPAHAVSHKGDILSTNHKVPSMFYGNLNETIRSFANSSVSGYHPLFGQPDSRSKPMLKETNLKSSTSRKLKKQRESSDTSGRQSSKRTTAPQAPMQQMMTGQSSFQSMYHSHPSIYGLPP